MIWIKNHGIRGESDDLRIPLAESVDEMSCHQNDPEGCPAIIVMRGWTGIDIDASISEVRDDFKSALGSQLRFADVEDANHEDFNRLSDELDAFYSGNHPDLNDNE